MPYKKAFNAQIKLCTYVKGGIGMTVDKERLIEEFIKLVSIDSPSLLEREMGDYLKDKLKGLGFVVTEDGAGSKLGGNCGNIYGFLEGKKELEPLLFCVHMDTVEPSRGKQAVVGDDGVIRSKADTVLGADDLAGVAAILEALSVIKEKELEHRPIEVLFTVAEEIYCKGAKVFDYSNIKSTEAYVLDLTGAVGAAAYQAPSILSLVIEVNGKASHAGFAPHKGIHAIQAAADAITKLKLGQIDENTTLNIGVIQGGLATNIIPELCAVGGEIRSYSHKTAMELSEEVKKQFERSAEAIGATVKFEVITNCQAYETPKDHPVVLRFKEVCDLLNLPFSLQQTFGGSDNNAMFEHGITGIVLACAMNQCHSCEEYTTVDELVRIAEVTKALMVSEVNAG
ncbi:M20/M25/M40 family metallo-hydrolase [Kineothrix sp. MB12-C1]|uniref:M20/M25/M40 family metallo-hydrolase n=1 Tax=Kineothrix sp. MB12-C1 TaxID=3070215 RepID=UPI0027D23382|nr:M20/M25/M40 family metallo-hydrolase [Kineothrix sp. MB12-C1]WMC93401.1 M20/M25/M40 family metallo-hydrolase [Kineothrix sp. MB12-C1]